jgi:hypothetical protein
MLDSRISVHHLGLIRLSRPVESIGYPDRWKLPDWP